MSFRALIILKRIVTPMTFALPFLLFLLPDVPTAVCVASSLPVMVVLFVSGVVNWKLESQHVFQMRCPVCARVGLAGRGVTWAVGWWLQCEDCGTVKPGGIFGLSFRIEPPGD